MYRKGLIRLNAGYEKNEKHQSLKVDGGFLTYSSVKSNLLEKPTSFRIVK